MIKLLSILVAAGMVARDYTWDTSGRRTALSEYRIRDNYLILSNLDAVIRRLDIAPESVISAAPYFQRRTKRHDACQIDLLIHTKNTLYVCEIKFRKRIDTVVTDEVLRKIRKLPGRSKYSIRPVLIYEGNLAPGIKRSDVFCRLITGADLLANP